MQFFTTVMATLMLGGALLPTAFAAKYPCEIGNSRNRGESCSNEGWYGCSNNLKHTRWWSHWLSAGVGYGDRVDGGDGVDEKNVAHLLRAHQQKTIYDQALRPLQTPNTQPSLLRTPPLEAPLVVEILNNKQFYV
ncbi:hypothetical protein IG631_11126 [Alternaria alternata]|nr:hypothetical protein IG631_11126 [Alternaria alternata]